MSLLSPLPEVLTISAGGGSALLPAPIPPITLEEKQTLTKLLAARGATIQELNTIRKALSQLKGGGLAQAAYPAQVHESLLPQAALGWWMQARMYQEDESLKQCTNWQGCGMGSSQGQIRGASEWVRGNPCGQVFCKPT